MSNDLEYIKIRVIKIKSSNSNDEFDDFENNFDFLDEKYGFWDLKPINISNINEIHLEQNDEDYDSDTLCYDYKNELIGITYHDIDPVLNPYMDLGEWSPKQINTVSFADDKEARVIAEQTEKGLNITINGQTILCPNEQKKYDEAVSANGRAHAVMFYDFNNDGIRDIFVVEIAYYIAEPVEDSDVLYLSGHFIKVNTDLSMKMLGGDKLFCKSGFDEIKIYPDYVITEDLMNTGFVSYTIKNDRVVKEKHNDVD